MQPQNTKRRPLRMSLRLGLALLAVWVAFFGVFIGACEAEPKRPSIPWSIKKQFNTLDYQKQFKAIDKLVAMGPQFIPALIEMLADKSSRYRFCATQALGRYGKAAIPALKKALGHKNRVIVTGAVKSLGLIGPPARGEIPRLYKILDKKSDPLQFEASRAIARIGLSETQELEFIALMKTRSPRFTMGLCMVVQRLGSTLPKGVDVVLRDLLRNRSSPRLRVEVVKAFAARSLNTTVQSSLIGAIRDSQPKVRREVFRALIRFSKQQPKLLETVHRYYLRASRVERKLIAGLLGEGGEEVATFVENILGWEKVEVVAAEATSALMVGGPSAEKALEKAFAHSSELVRRRAVFVAAGLGPRGRLFCPQVLALFKSKASEETRSLCLWFFGEVKAKAPEVEKILLTAAEGSSLPLQVAAMGAFGRLGQKKPAILKALNAGLTAKSKRVQEKAKQSLEALGAQ